MSRQLRSEAARERELYRYWQPNESVFPQAEYDETFNRDYTPRPSYDSALTAYAQLGALRCNAKRGLISVVDQSYQYIIAEGTKTLSLQDGSVTDQDDQIWFGLRSIPRSVGICAMALGQFTEVESQDDYISDTLFEPLRFIIPDLSKDCRFESQPFVCGAPFLRFYAGVPIRSPAGHIIGIYSIVDDKPRYDFGERDLDILQDLAATVMDHLVLGTVRGRHHRADRMVKGLGLFIEGKATLRDWWLRSGHLAQGPTNSDGSKGDWTLKARADAEFGPQVHAIPNDHNSKHENGHDFKSSESALLVTKPVVPGSAEEALNSAPIDTMLSDSALPGLVNPSTREDIIENAVGLPSVQESTSLNPAGWENGDTSKKPGIKTTTATSQDMATMFKRASNLIRESITVEGCVFLDASSATMENVTLGVDIEEPDYDVDRGKKPKLSHYDSFSQGSMCEVLGYSVVFDVDSKEGQTTPSFQIPKDTLHRLLKRYPNGSILNFEQNGSLSSSEEEPSNNLNTNSTPNEDNSKAQNQERKLHLKKIDNQIIMNSFPGIQRLAFFPLWDSRTKSWFCGALAWTNDPHRILDADDDIAYLAAFGNSIMAEKARLDASMVDQMKSNFISTVSHELRSPLHGILASAELLKDMTVSASQIDVISMINICGRTLLDTINHVLDFTELNRLRKSKLLEKNKWGRRDAAKTQSPSSSSLFKQTANLDLSILVEEVVESTLIGHNHGRSESLVMLKANLHPASLEGHSNAQTNAFPRLANNNVKVIMDIDSRSSWVISLQPGAWKRIVMNLFGNALKYTKNGHVCVSLRSMAYIAKHDSRPLAVLTVSDTGKGISKEFLKNHLFKPFWQQDSLAIGNGLGLSIVQQIVRDLGGHIEIKSREGSGTRATVQIPLEFPSQSLASTYAIDDILHLSIRQKMKGLKVHLISSTILPESRQEAVSEMSETDAASVLSIMKSLRKTLKNWFEIEVIETSSINSADSDVYLLVVDELSTERNQNGNNSILCNPDVVRLAEANALVVLCTTPTSKKTMEMQKANHVVQLPFGPHKLANAFSALLERKVVSTQPPISQLESISASKIVQNISVGDTIVHIESLSITTDAITTTLPQPPVSPLPFTVLLVEDNDINLKILVMYMRKLKRPYQTVGNGLEAVQTFKKHPLALRLILMDITMPVMDGLAATREIRRHERALGLPPATIIALTGASSAGTREQATFSGVDEFLTKPVPLSVVKSLIDGWKQQPVDNYEKRMLRDQRQNVS